MSCKRSTAIMAHGPPFDPQKKRILANAEKKKKPLQSSFFYATRQISAST